MQTKMSQTDLNHALDALAPRTKSARIRAAMPTIEAKIADGVRIADVVEALRASGLELSESTLKSYLHRNRKKSGAAKGRVVGSLSEAVDGAISANGPLSKKTMGNEPSAPTTGGPISMQELDRIMKPDPAQQAEDMARYERIGRQQRRKRTP